MNTYENNKFNNKNKMNKNEKLNELKKIKIGNENVIKFIKYKFGNPEYEIIDKILMSYYILNGANQVLMNMLKNKTITMNHYILGLTYRKKEINSNNMIESDTQIFITGKIKQEEKEKYKNEAHLYSSVEELKEEIKSHFLVNKLKTELILKEEKNIIYWTSCSINDIDNENYEETNNRNGIDLKNEKVSVIVYGDEENIYKFYGSNQMKKSGKIINDDITGIVAFKVRDVMDVLPHLYNFRKMRKTFILC